MGLRLCISLFLCRYRFQIDESRQWSATPSAANENYCFLAFGDRHWARRSPTVSAKAIFHFQHGELAYWLRRALRPSAHEQSALFNFQSLLLVFLLLICTSTYVRGAAPGLIDRNKSGLVNTIPLRRISTRRDTPSSLTCIHWGMLPSRQRISESSG